MCIRDRWKGNNSQKKNSGIGSKLIGVLSPTAMDVYRCPSAGVLKIPNASYSYLSRSREMSLVTLNANFMSSTEYSGYASLHRQDICTETVMTARLGMSETGQAMDQFVPGPYDVLAVTGGAVIGKCGRFSQLIWLLGAL